MKTDLEELEKQAEEAEKRIKELQRIKELRKRINEAKVLEDEVEPGFFKKAAKGIDKLSNFISVDSPRKDKRKKKGERKLVYKGLKL